MSDNTITDIVPQINAALDTISRELYGFIPAVRNESSLMRAAKDQDIRFNIVPSLSAGDITPAATGPDPAGITIGSDTLTISKSRSVDFQWNGEEEKGLTNAGVFKSTLQQQFEQAFRTLGNEIETDLAVTAKEGASRAFGTAGTTPFGSNFDEISELRRILDDNGAPPGERSLIINTAAAVNLRQLTTLVNVDSAGSNRPLREGALLDLHGFAVGESAQIALHTKGTGTGYLVNNGAGILVGGNVIANDTGTGTLIKGDTITFAADANNKYNAITTLAAGTFNIGTPGVRVAIADDNAITIGDDYTPGSAFTKDAILLITRPPAVPAGGDSADDFLLMMDPRTGLAFEIRLYRQFRRLTYHVAMAWGFKAIKNDNIVTLLG